MRAPPANDPRRAHPPSHMPKYQKPTPAAIAITTATAYGTQSFFIGMPTKQNTPLRGMTAPQPQQTCRGSARLGGHPAFAFRSMNMTPIRVSSRHMVLHVLTVGSSALRKSNVAGMPAVV
jgi:hypothetical protein